MGAERVVVTAVNYSSAPLFNRVLFNRVSIIVELFGLIMEKGERRTVVYAGVASDVHVVRRILVAMNLNYGDLVLPGGWVAFSHG